MVEHCDARYPDGVTAPSPGSPKGFLLLEEEIEAVIAANGVDGPDSSTSIGISINWARSVLERREVYFTVFLFLHSTLPHSCDAPTNTL